jgi:cysteine desulfurase
VSVMHANNETGVIQPIENIATEVRARRQAGQSFYFHSDGVQAFGKIAINTSDVDLYAISAHKIYGPKGIGLLAARKNTSIGAIQFGGRHERGRRPGTENVPGAIAFARAFELCTESDMAHLKSLRDRFESELASSVADITVNGAAVARLPNTSSVTFHGISGEAMLIALDLKGIAVSSGSACSSGALEPSHVLLAMGLSRETAKSTIRFSFGRYNSLEDIDKLLEELAATVRRLRRSREREAQLV